MFLEVKNLDVYYKTVNGTSHVLDGFNLKMDQGGVVSIVGESGSGKSTLGLAITKLLPMSAIEKGEIYLDGTELVGLSESQITNYRGTTVFMIFQNPLNSLNPVKTVGSQLAEAVRIRSRRKNENLTADEIYNEAVQTLKLMRLPDPQSIMTRYPHELSGGQVQRVVISMALILKPKLLIADEPTTALDVTIQAQVINLLKEMNKTYKMSIIFITHDLSLAYVLSDQVIVMYAGRIMEQGVSESLIRKPLHPYTAGLLMSVPTKSKDAGPLFSISGAPPSFFNLPKGCKFFPRCKEAFTPCGDREPAIVPVDSSMVRCWLYE